jgi:hypothetical protein
MTVTVSANFLGAAIDHFRVQVTNDAMTVCETPNNSTFTCVISGLPAGNYTFTSYAISPSGSRSAPSPPSNLVTVP